MQRKRDQVDLLFLGRVIYVSEVRDQVEVVKRLISGADKKL